MPNPSPFHSRTAPLVESHEWRNWSGYLAASVYEPSHEREYFAIRNSAGLIDISPLYKYEITAEEIRQIPLEFAVNEHVAFDLAAGMQLCGADVMKRRDDADSVAQYGARDNGG